MKRSLFIIFAMLTTAMVTAYAQTAREELSRDPRCSASNFMAYPGPVQQQLTPAPRGMKPFYLSHYGRHGSRYMSKLKEYDHVYDILTKASRLKKLTALGEDVLRRVTLIRQEAIDRTGELTPLGESQHRDIARRMVEHFPEVFKGKAHVDARSTLAVRCILSMQQELIQLARMNPRLNIVSDASMSDSYFMNFTDKRLLKMIYAGDGREAYDAYCRQHACWQRVVGQLFADTVYASTAIDGERLNYYLFRLASNVQNMEVRHELTLYDLFTEEERLKNWQMNNAYWFLGYGHTPLNGNMQPYMQRNLLRRIITEADSCLQLPHPGASLRFGHDTVLLPLVCLMGVNGYDQSIADLDQLERRGWVDYRVFAMACNLQIVFYRRPAKSDSDVLIKVLLNENEATLPLTPVQGPYYRWADVRDYFLTKLSKYQDED